jgi:hypothetical protein
MKDRKKLNKLIKKKKKEMQHRKSTAWEINNN